MAAGVQFYKILYNRTIPKPLNLRGGLVTTWGPHKTGEPDQEIPAKRGMEWLKEIILRYLILTG